jgi:predicted acetyltransferase
MNIEVVPARLEDKPILGNLMELYQYDFSEFDGADVSEHGLYGYEYLDYYWTEPGRYPYLVRVDGKLAGFALVNRYSLLGRKDTRTVAEFFIMRKYRRRGVGALVAGRLFGLFPGKWEVAQVPENQAAQAFWRKVIGSLTKGRFEEIQVDNQRWHGPVQFFEFPPRSEKRPALKEGKA